LSEAIYQELRLEKDPVSVHLCDYPLYDVTLRLEVLEYDMQEVQKVVSMGHSLRKEHKIKVRQPLALANVVLADAKALEALKRQKALIAEELNVKEVAFFEDETAFVALKILPNYRTLGKKAGKRMNQVKQEVEKLSAQQIKRLQGGHPVTITVEGETIVIDPEDIQVKREVLGQQIAFTLGELTITLDTTLNEALIQEGFARELVNKINTLRKTEGLQITDRIHITLETTDTVRRAFEAYKDYICHEVLATQVRFSPCEGVESDLNGETAKIEIVRDRV